MSDHYLVKEGHCLAVFNSTHRVLRAEGLLKGMGLDILLIPAPRALQTDCGLALRFDRQSLAIITATLKDHDLLPAYICHLQDGQYIRHHEEETNDHH
jgi:hypothetical protein